MPLVSFPPPTQTTSDLLLVTIDQSVFSRIFIDEIIHISSSEPDISLHTTLLRLVHVAACVNSSLLFIVDCVPLYR